MFAKLEVCFPALLSPTRKAPKGSEKVNITRINVKLEKSPIRNRSGCNFKIARYMYKCVSTSVHILCKNVPDGKG